jgi:hypothetical protein
MRSGFWIALGALVGVMLATLTFSHTAQSQEAPFRVFGTIGACVYVTGGNGGPVAITALPKKDLMIVGEFKGC